MAIPKPQAPEIWASLPGEATRRRGEDEGREPGSESCALGTDCFRWWLSASFSSGFNAKISSKIQSTFADAHMGRVLNSFSPKSTSRELRDWWSHLDVLHCFFLKFRKRLRGLVWTALQTPSQSAILQLKHRVSWIFFQTSLQTTILAYYLQHFLWRVPPC